jgi:hypothetical protein
VSHAKMVAARKNRRAVERVAKASTAKAFTGSLQRLIFSMMQSKAFLDRFAVVLLPITKSIAEAAAKREQELIVRCGPPVTPQAEIKTFTAADITRSIGWQVAAAEELDSENISG